ncbi:MAG TPA: ABC transporter ATP-binding protein [Luteitalea sp.]|nr:ABC transporter ATP-binding protein [Luteitalea sp.]
MPATLTADAWRRFASWIADRRGVDVHGEALDRGIRRIAVNDDGPVHDRAATLLASVGVGTILVRRTLNEVIADASTKRPWVAFSDTPASNEPIAILGTRWGRVLACRPAVSPRLVTMRRAQVARTLGLPDAQAQGVWLVNEPEAPLSAMRATGPEGMSPIRRLRAMLHDERQTLSVAIIYSVVIGLMSLVVPIAVQSLVNTIAFGTALQPLVVLTGVVGIGLGFAALLNGLRAVVVEILQRSLFARTAVDVTYRLLHVRADAFDRFHGPELVNRFFDVVTVQKSAALLLIDGLSIVMQTAIGMVLLALYHPWLLVFDVVLVVAMLVIVLVLGRGAIATSINESKAKYALEAWLEQIAAHLVTFKSDGGAAYATRRSEGLLDEYLAYRARHFRILLRQIVGAFALQALASSALLGIGGWLVISRQLTLGQLVASELVVALMVSAFTKFGKQLEMFYDLVAATDKLGALVDLPLERDGGEVTPAHDTPAAITLADVRGGYADSDGRPTLDVSLDVEPGARLGITGPLGSGKSTLADMLFGLRVPDAGTVLLDGIDIRDVPLPEWRRSVVLVRAVEIFPGTVIDNIRLGREDITVEDISRTLDRVGVLDELRAMPDGLATRLQPNARPLSSRQALRLMLARGMAARPRLLVLDGVLDAVLDTSRDSDQLLDALFGPDAPWTLVCTTDEPAVLARCTRVVTLRDGRVAASRAPEVSS